MPSLNIKVLGTAELLRGLKKSERRFQSQLRRNLAKAAEVVVGNSKREFKGSRTRAIRKGRPVTAPRGKLAVDFAQYKKAISKEIRGRRDRLRAIIGPVGIRYARRHELGTRGMPKRPVLVPGLKKSERFVVQLLGRTLRVILP